MILKTSPETSIKPLFLSFRIIRHNLGESFICGHDGKREQESDLPHEGARTALHRIFLDFYNNGRISEGELWISPAARPTSIGDIDVRSHQRLDGDWLSCGTETFEKSVLEALHVLYWSKHRSEKGRFADVVHSIRTCTVCGREQRGILTGFTRHHPVQPNFAWPADVCVDPDCLSHKLDETVDPKGYQDRREELRKVMETENGRNDIPKDIRRAVGQAKTAKLLD